jgi:DNA (cytosine-5)-methyltransferase 1
LGAPGPRERDPFEAIILDQIPAVLPVWRKFAEVFEECDYLVAPPAVLHAEEYGVPQTHWHSFLIARRRNSFRSGNGLSLPEPTHRGYRNGVLRQSGDRSRKPWMTMSEALRDSRRGGFEIVSNYETGGDPKTQGAAHLE